MCILRNTHHYIRISLLPAMQPTPAVCRVSTVSSCKQANLQKAQAQGVFHQHHQPGDGTGCLQGESRAKYKQKFLYLLWRHYPLLMFTEVQCIFPSQACL